MYLGQANIKEISKVRITDPLCVEPPVAGGSHHKG